MEGGKFYATILSVSEYSRTDTLWVYVSIVVVKDLTYMCTYCTKTGMNKPLHIIKSYIFIT